MPVVELDLKKDLKKGEEDKRTPYFFLGAIATNFHQTAALSLAMALSGHKVYVPMQPEQSSVERPDDFGKTLREQGNLKPYAELARQTVKKIGLKEFNLLGYSMGATTALELAVNPDFEGIKDLIIIEPLGIEQKGLTRLAKEAVFGQVILKTLPSSEARIKTFLQGAEAGQGKLSLLLATANILSKKHFSPEKLKAINPKGRFQVWIGDRSPFVNKKTAENVFGETERLRRTQNQDFSPLEFYEVKSGDHGWPMMNALGLSRTITGEKPKEWITKVKTKDLENSAMAGIIKDIKK